MLIVVVLIALCGLVNRCDGDGGYTMEIDNFEINTEYDHKYVNWDTLGLKKKARNKFVVGGTFSLNRNLANEQKIIIQIYPYDKERQVKSPMVFHTEEEICTFIEKDKSVYPGLREKSNLPEPGTCPIPKNDYTIEDYEMDADFLPADAPRGDYLLVCLLRDGANVVAGFSVIINISD